MNTQTKTPDLLTPVCDAVAGLTPRHKRELAAAVDVAPMTLDHLMDRTRRYGPSHALVTRLYQTLIVEQWKGRD